MEIALAAARRNGLRRTVRCLFAENLIDKKLLAFESGNRAAALPLWQRQMVLHFDDLLVGPADTYLSNGAITVVHADGRRSPIDTPAQLLDLLADSFDFTPGAEGLESFRRDSENSIHNDALARLHRAHWNAQLGEALRGAGCTGLVAYLREHLSVKDAAMLLDQWGSLEGHPFYPTWKSKPGLSDDEVRRLSPEFAARVPVRIAALRADMAYMERMPHVDNYHDWFAAHYPQLWAAWSAGLRARGLAPAGWLPLPIHSWHLEHYVKATYAEEIADGLLLLDGPDLDTLPTMSFRTVLPAGEAAAPFIKLPIALWLTSEQRSLQAKSIHMGPRISAIVEQILFAEEGFGKRLEIFPEDVAFHYRHAATQDDAPGRHLSVVYRASKAAFERTDRLIPITVASLFTLSPATGRPLITELIGQGGGADMAQAAQDYFRKYLAVVLQPVIGIYLLYGIGLEAHQQNSTVLFAPDGTPQRLLLRDFGDTRVYQPLLAARGFTLQPYVYKKILPTVFTEAIDPVRFFVLDACYFCHLHELALLLTQQYQLEPTVLWRIMREETERAFDALAPRLASPRLLETERAAFLEQPWSTRSVLRMHLQKYTDYRIQHELPNPLAKPAA